MTIKSGFSRRAVLFFGIAALVYATGCSTAQKKGEGGVPTAVGAEENTASGDSDTNKALGLQTVHFPYDSFLLESEAKSVLDANAQIMSSKPSLKVQIEGHCDQRGGIQYNIALGEKRANSAKNYLVDKGISADRISVISFGKEKPVDTGSGEEAYAKNRRGNFVVTSH